MSKKVPQLQHSKPMTVDSYKTNCLSVTPIAGPGASSLPRSPRLQRAALQDLSRALQKELLLGTCGVFRIRVSCSLGWSRTHDPPDLSSRELGLSFPYRPFSTRFSFLRFLLETNGKPRETSRSRPAGAPWLRGQRNKPGCGCAIH